MPFCTLTVSRVIFTILKEIYGRLSPVVLTAVDNTVTLCCDWQLQRWMHEKHFYLPSDYPVINTQPD